MIQYPIVRLDAPGLESLPIDMAEIVGQVLDLGDAVTRTVVQDAPDADGTIDTTSHTGARTVTLSLILAPNPGNSLWALEQRLRAFTHPAVRPTMVLTQEPGAPEQQIGLRRSQWSGTLGGAGSRTGGSNTDTVRSIVMQWVAPLGILESSEVHVARAPASGGAIVGRTYPVGGRTYPRVYPASAPSGQALVVNAGNTAAYPLIRLYGPVGTGLPGDEVEIANRTTGQTIVLTGLVIAAGEFLELDTRAKTTLYLGNPTDPRYNLWTFTRSNWWTLAPGLNDIRYIPDTYSAPAEATIEWRDAWQ